MAKKTGVIILAHGSKIKEANDIIHSACRHIKNRNGLSVVEPAFLQLSQPDLASAARKAIAEAGCKKIVIVPFFLFTGNHVSRDIPKAIEEQKGIYKGVEFVYTRNLGQDQRINDIVYDRIKEAL